VIKKIIKFSPEDLRRVRGIACRKKWSAINRINPIPLSRLSTAIPLVGRRKILQVLVKQRMRTLVSAGNPKGKGGGRNGFISVEKK